MNFGRRFMALMTCSAIFSLHSAPACALPQPRSEEWWFNAWEIQNKVWPISRGQGVVIAVIDSGVEARLPDLEGVVLPGFEYGASHKGDGRRDLDTELGGHGTAMAALIAGQGHGTRMVGVAPQSRILPISEPVHNDADTIRYAVDHKARVINISAHSKTAQCPTAVQESVDYALQRDVIIVASIGNDGREGAAGSPANCAGVLAVGAVDADLKSWEESTPSDKLILVAPGVSVGSIGKDGTFNWKNNGTSQATALTSAVAALIRSRFPKMPAREVVQRMIATAKDTGPKGWDKRTGYGALIPYLALTADIPSNSPNPVYNRLDRLMSPNSNAPNGTPSVSMQSDLKGSSNRPGMRIYIVLGLIASIGVVVSFYSFKRLRR